ncbi:unnamed protein product, partial [Oppiella nova]
QKRLFVREYIRHSKHLTIDRETEDQLIREADYFALAAHLLWTLWCITKARTSPMRYGFWECSKDRLNAYRKHKELYQTATLGNH